MSDRLTRAISNNLIRAIVAVLVTFIAVWHEAGFVWAVAALAALVAVDASCCLGPFAAERFRQKQ